MVDLVTNDTGSVLRVTCTDNDTGAAIDLTGATVRARWEDADGVMQTYVMTIADAVNGIATYQFQTGEIVYPLMRIEIEVTDGFGYVTSNLDLIELTVREELG